MVEVKTDLQNVDNKKALESKLETNFKVLNDTEKDIVDVKMDVDKTSNTISNYNDEKLQQETKHVISSLTKEELNKLKSTLDNDIKQNGQYDGQLYEYLTNIINEIEQDSKSTLDTDIKQKYRKKRTGIEC
eukprot:431543_1